MTLYKGTFAEGAADIDTRYFYVAGKLWTQGESPYSVETWQAAWSATFADDSGNGSFAYLPSAALFCIPIGLTNWETAGVVFRVLNILAYLGILGVCAHLLWNENRPRPKWPWERYAWLALAASIGANAGTLLTGQSTLIAMFGVMLTLASRSIGIATFGSLLALSKPHVTLPLLAVFVLAPQFRKRHVVFGVAIAGALSAILLLLNGVGGFLESLRVYAANPVTALGNLVGTAPLLISFGLPAAGARALAVLTGACAVALLVLCAHWQAGSRLAVSTILVAALALNGWLQPLQPYDLCVFMPLLALISTLPLRLRVALVVPALILWRPRLAQVIPESLAAHNLVISVVWLSALALVFTPVLLASVRLRRQRATA